MIDAAVAASAARLLTDTWVPQDPSAEALDQVWTLGTKAGWFDLDGEGSAPALLAIADALGRAACPIPLADAYVATRLLPDELAAEVRRGALRLAVTSAADQVRGLEAASALTHVLVIGDGSVDLHPVTIMGTEPGTARPEWGLGDLAEPTWSADPGLAVTDAAKTVLRLALAARAAGGAARLHELAVAHACTREQFGKVIGTFGAVQQRAATGAIAVAGAALLLREAAQALETKATDWELTAELAVRHIAESARTVLLGAHHTLGAVSYFSEHIGPWLFRRVHADLAQSAALLPSAGTVIDRLVEGRGAMPAVGSNAATEAFRAQVRAVIAELRTGDDTFDRDAAIAALVEQQWLGMAWPEALGGRSAPLGELAVLHHEFSYARVPVEIELASVLIVGDAIVAHGTPAQQAKFLPLVRSGRMRFCLGYSEPETGSDLAALRTRATRVEGGWRINGQKIWTTRAINADYIWLAARTDPDASPRHAGITLFVVPTSTPGVTINPMIALSGETAATVFLDDVAVGDDDVVGEVNGGWQVITAALAGERVLMGGIAALLQRALDDVLAAARRSPGLVGARGSASRAQLDSVAGELQALHCLVRSALGDSPQARLAAPMAGVLGGELAERFGGVLLDVLGPDALRTGGVAGRWAEYLNRLAPMYVIGGGTNDIQRGLIARGLGLPR